MRAGRETDENQSTLTETLAPALSTVPAFVFCLTTLAVFGSAPFGWTLPSLQFAFSSVRSAAPSLFPTSFGTLQEAAEPLFPLLLPPPFSLPGELSVLPPVRLGPTWTCEWISS